MTAIIKIHNVETGEEIEREMNADELKQLAADQKVNEAENKLKNELEAKKESAQAKLALLGLTEDDLKALGLA